MVRFAPAPGPRGTPTRQTPRVTEGRGRIQWDHIAEVFLDPEDGSWRHELDPANRASSLVWEGQTDTYHAPRATLIPRLLLAPALAVALAVALGEGLLG